MDNRYAVLFKYSRRHNRIRDSCFVLKAEKHKTFRGARPLPRDHSAGHPHMRPVRQTFEFARRKNPLPPHARAVIFHRVRTYGHPRAAKIGHQPFFRRHLL